MVPPTGFTRNIFLGELVIFYLEKRGVSEKIDSPCKFLPEIFLVTLKYGIIMDKTRDRTIT